MSAKQLISITIIAIAISIIFMNLFLYLVNNKEIIVDEYIDGMHTQTDIYTGKLLTKTYYYEDGDRCNAIDVYKRKHIYLGTMIVIEEVKHSYFRSNSGKLLLREKTIKKYDGRSVIPRYEAKYVDGMLVYETKYRNTESGVMKIMHTIIQE